MRPVLAILAVLTAILFRPAGVAAHSDLVETEPAAGSRLGEPPREVVMTFESELVADGSRFVVTAPDGSEAGTGALDLDVADRNVLRGSVEITAPGTYTVAWTAVSLDGHGESDAFTFDYGTAAPDTALAIPDPPSGPAAAGVLLLTASATWLVMLRRRHARSA